MEKICLDGRRNFRGNFLRICAAGMLCLLAGTLNTTSVCARSNAEVASQAMADETAKGKKASDKPMIMNPVGRVVRQGDRAFIEIFPEFAPAMDGLTGFSHIWVFFWFHGNDTPENRAILKVHPRNNPANPLTGVFATRSPVRPNLIGLTACRLLKVEGLRLEVEGLDAWDDTPVVDIKPYLPGKDAIPQATSPEWVKRPSHKSE
ncbi:MAG: tRNA (N6-threonylcarbamoyladenosine(37)-N6)-methyltransferase TrmO [Deltaproteobacteria bacterium]|nr:tRNA (N6-threonylcarbamoyladenosine(37)-N6)-methyltransferase TrmO [Deltaproteobacteria bacterium]